MVDHADQIDKPRDQTLWLYKYGMLITLIMSIMYLITSLNANRGADAEKVVHRELTVERKTMGRIGDAGVEHLRESFCSLGMNASNIANLAMLAAVLKCLLRKAPRCVANSAKHY